MPGSTLEVRWFFERSLAETGAGVEAWFRARPQPDGAVRRSLSWEPSPPAWRADRYVLVPGSDDMGIKWREGRLEIKGRTAELGRRAFGPGIEGRCERWIKWSYAGAAVERRCREHFGQGAPETVTVEKRRLQRFLRFDDAGAPVEVDREPPRSRGVNVELAEICLATASGKHWSLAFEAFPGNDEGAFARAVTWFLGGMQVSLTVERSMSYPRWLRHPLPG